MNDEDRPRLVAAAMRTAYLLTGDRERARVLAAQALACTPQSVEQACRYVARAARVGMAATDRQEPLWHAIRRLPRQQQAEIVQRLSLTA